MQYPIIGPELSTSCYVQVHAPNDYVYSVCFDILERAANCNCAVMGCTYTVKYQSGFTRTTHSRSRVHCGLQQIQSPRQILPGFEQRTFALCIPLVQSSLSLCIRSVVSPQVDVIPVGIRIKVAIKVDTRNCNQLVHNQLTVPVLLQSLSQLLFRDLWQYRICKLMQLHTFKDRLHLRVAAYVLCSCRLLHNPFHLTYVCAELLEFVAAPGQLLVDIPGVQLIPIHYLLRLISKHVPLERTGSVPWYVLRERGRAGIRQRVGTLL